MSSNFPDQSKIIKAIIKGMEKARQNFLFWTNNRLFLSHAPNQTLTIHIAQEIAKLPNAPEIFIDATVADILRCSLKDREGYWEYMRKNSLKQGTFSITLDERFEHKGDNDSISRVVIETVNGIRNPKSEYTYEIERICKMLNASEKDGSSLDYGVLAFYSDLSSNARKKLSTRISSVVKSFDEIVQKFPKLHSDFISTEVKKVENIGEYILGAYTIQRRENEN